MIRCNSFSRGVIFAAIAAAGCLPWMLLTGPVLGTWNALALYLIGVTILCVAGLGPRSAGALRVALVAGLAASVAALAVRSTSELAIALAAIIGIARSGWLYRAAPARAVVIEATLLGGGLLFARHLVGPDLASAALALWGFLLIQSLFFVIGGVRSQRSAPGQIDPFEEAHRRALTLLEDPG